MATVINLLNEGHRRCGGCSLCCKLLPVQEIDKPSGQKCKHQSFKGCGIYHKAGFPNSCALWSCRWLNGSDTEKLHRPDRVHYVIDAMPDVVTINDNNTGETIHIEAIQVWVDPRHPKAWHDPELKAFLDRRGREGKCAIIRYSGKTGFVLFPPSMCADGQWHEEGGSVTPELSPQQRFERLEAAHGQKVMR